MLRKISVIALIPLMGLISFAAVLSAEERITVFVDNLYPPYMYGSPTDAKGIYPELIKTVFHRMKIMVDIKALPWKRALRKGKEGQGAIGGIYKNSKRVKLYDYSEPIFKEKLAVYVKKGKTFDFKKLSDLKGKTVGVNLGWSYGQEFDKLRDKGLFKADEARGNWANLTKLTKGRVNCVVADQLSASQIIHQENFGSEIEKLLTPASVNNAYIVFAKNLNKRDLLNKFNSALAEIIKDGTYNKMVESFVSK